MLTTLHMGDDNLDLEFMTSDAKTASEASHVYALCGAKHLPGQPPRAKRAARSAPAAERPRKFGLFASIVIYVFKYLHYLLWDLF